MTRTESHQPYGVECIVGQASGAFAGLTGICAGWGAIRDIRTAARLGQRCFSNYATTGIEHGANYRDNSAFGTIKNFFGKNTARQGNYQMRVPTSGCVLRAG